MTHFKEQKPYTETQEVSRNLKFVTNNTTNVYNFLSIITFNGFFSRPSQILNKNFKGNEVTIFYKMVVNVSCILPVLTQAEPGSVDMYCFQAAMAKQLRAD